MRNKIIFTAYLRHAAKLVDLIHQFTAEACLRRMKYHSELIVIFVDRTNGMAQLFITKKHSTLVSGDFLVPWNGMYS